jgi:FAD/FMN-containing dehydrogenase
VRLIERDDESYLAWARQDWACIVFNLHSDHDAESLERSAAAFRALIDLAIDNDGSYYLTYHRHATRGQVLACYQNFPGFLRAKRRYDPREIFQSEWYRFYASMFAERLSARG